MSKPIKSAGPPTHCPGCRQSFDPKWFVCPYCGLRLKPGEDLWLRVLMWLGVLVTFVLSITLIGRNDPDAAAGLGIIVGMPLAYVFGKAVLFRMMGEPLTWNQLAKTSIRTALWSFFLFVVVPIVLGLAFLIFAFVMCAGMVGMGH